LPADLFYTPDENRPGGSAGRGNRMKCFKRLTLFPDVRQGLNRQMDNKPPNVLNEMYETLCDFAWNHVLLFSVAGMVHSGSAVHA
jgi:hypothetical protein